MNILTLQKIDYLLFKFLLFNILVTSCVTVRIPEGGPPDTTLPEIVSSNPKHESTNFKGEKITISFNKAIGVEDIYNQLIIMPTLQKPNSNKQAYQYKIRGKSLIIKPACPLKKDTTYSFTFNKVIKDLKEGNKAKNSILTFSTGNSLDAFSVEGQVIDLLKNQSLDRVNIFLYHTEHNIDQEKDIEDIQKSHTKETIDTSQKEKVTKKTTETEKKEEVENQITPDYVTQTGPDGKFKLTHIKEGIYNIHVHNGEANKFAIDYQKNSYGFLPNPLNIKEPIQNIVIPMVNWDVSDFKLIKQQKNNQFFEITCNKPIMSYSLVPIPLQKSKKSPTIWSHLVEEKQVIRVYNTLGLLQEDSCKALLKAVDAIGNTIEESILIQFNEGEYKKEKIQCTIKSDSEVYITHNFTATIHFNKPIKELFLEGIYFAYNEKKIIPLTSEDIHLNAQKDELTISKKFPLELISLQKETETITQGSSPNKKQDIVLYLMENSLIAADNSKNETKSFNFSLKDEKKHGSISGKITTKVPGFIIQLLDEKYEVIDFIRNKETYEFKMIKPGDYMLRILVLNDKEAAWSAGNIRKNIPPDPVIFYPDKIGVLENWEVIDINLKF